MTQSNTHAVSGPVEEFGAYPGRADIINVRVAGTNHPLNSEDAETDITVDAGTRTARRVNAVELFAWLLLDRAEVTLHPRTDRYGVSTTAAFCRSR